MRARITSEGKILLLCTDVSDIYEELIADIDSRYGLWSCFDVREKMFTTYFLGGLCVYSSPQPDGRTYIIVTKKTDGEECFVLDLDTLLIVRDSMHDSLVTEIITKQVKDRRDTLRQNRPKHIMEVVV